MSIWYAVFVKGQTTDQPVGLFRSVVDAAAFKKESYGERGEIQPVMLNGSIQQVTIDKTVIPLT